MFKKWMGLEFVDVLIQFGVTVGAAVLATGLGFNDELGVGGVMTASLIILAVRRRNALREMQSPDSLPGGEERIRELESRIADLEAHQERVMELEERVDFAERMLARERAPDRLGEG